MADTFGSASFDVLLEGQSRSDPSRVTVHQIPGGNAFFIDLAGQGPSTLSLNLHLASDAAYAALAALRNTSATLTYSEGTFTAVLTQLKRTLRLWDPASGLYSIQAQGEWILQ